MTSSLFSADAEKAVLGSLLAYPERVADMVFGQIKAADFFVPAHQILFAALLQMQALRAPVDIITVHQFLEDRGQAQEVGSPAILAELANTWATPLNVGSYAGTLLDKAKLRQCGKLARDIGQWTEEHGQAAPVIQAILRQAFALTEESATSQELRMDALMSAHDAHLESIRNSRNKLLGLSTGLAALDALTHGWQRGNMVVLAARPGVGKTALALNFALAATRERWSEAAAAFLSPGHAVGLLSVEMTAMQLTQRMACQATGIHFEALKKGDLTEFDWQAYHAKSAAIRAWPLYIDDCAGGLTVVQAQIKARKLQRLYGIELLIVDYLQLLHADSPQARQNRQNEVAEISRGMKAIARELDIPVIVLAQLNRRAEEGKAEPGLHNLRESGAIEQDADVVMILHRQEEGDPQERDARALQEYKLILAKQRNGPTGSLPLHFNGGVQTFYDATPRPKSPPATNL